ncbi:hypothetical protein L9F63_028309, partial [Diploptera punctata]
LRGIFKRAEHGVIYFNLGSMIRTETLPPEKRDAFLQAFAELPQRVLWKWEGEELFGLSKNVKISKWFPQFDILSHPNVYIYLGHGGLMGTIEAMYAGVPMIGIPFFGDQGMNIAAIESANAGLQLEYADINKESVLRAIKTLLEEPSYRKNAKRMSQIFKDRPHSAMDTAIYWTEYVIRHNGAPHLRSAALDLSWYQYLLLDVLVVIAVCLVTIFIILFVSIKTCISLLKTKSNTNKLKLN